MTLRASFITQQDIALFLDVDGTLIEIANSPDAVKVPASLRNTLELAAAHEAGAMALISGRKLGELDRLFAPSVFPAAGQHGFERRDAMGNITRPTVDTSGLQMARNVLASLVNRHPGLLLEDKGSGLALHYRNVPNLQASLQELMSELLIPLAPMFELKPGKYVLELTPAGFSKRTAIQAFMQETPFAGRTPVFVGDDVTDEDGFAAVNALGGYSIRVGSEAAPHSAARYQFSSVSAVIAWLRERNISGAALSRQI
ncbi:MAG: trehalose-phosphatase [Steroidobacteraceae bacterium]